MLSNPSSLFLYRKNELLKSIFDGFDLERNSAEYMMAYANLNVKPKDTLSLLCKSAAMEVLIFKDEGYVDEETKVTAPKKHKDPFAPVLMGSDLSAEPSRHPWEGKMPTTDEVGIRHAVWPDAMMSSKDAYRATPFHPSHYPLLRVDAITGRKRFVEHLKRMFLSSSEKEKAKSSFVADGEKKWHDHGLKTKNPAITGRELDGEKRYHFGGPLNIGGATETSNHDLYERDFRRWKLENGHGLNDDTHDLRNEHFNNRADEWEGEDTTFEAGEFSYDDAESEKGKHHGHGLGWAAYMLGMEWLSPEERTAVLEHLENNGNLSEEAQRIKLPDGTILPAARFVYNAMERITPELNWWKRTQSIHAPNMHKKGEDNENDFHVGVNRFLQRGLNDASHMPFYEDEESGESSSIADKILERIHEINPKFSEDKFDEDGKPVEHTGKIDVLPRFEFHNSGKWDAFSESFDSDEDIWKLIQSKAKNHKTKKNQPITPATTRLSREDLLFLAGYHPETEEDMLEHPLYGELENPIIPKDDIDILLDRAKTYSGQAAQAKDIREFLSKKRSRFGVRPEEDEHGLFDIHPDGTYTTTDGHHWWEAYGEKGGVGRNLSTYLEFIHYMMMNPKTGKSIFGSVNDDGVFQPNKNLNSISSLITPSTKPLDVEQKIDITTAKSLPFISKFPITMPPEFVLSPHGISATSHDSNGVLLNEGSTVKNNYTDHMSSTNAKYTNDLQILSPDELKAATKKSGWKMPHPFTETTFTTIESPYGEGASDKISDRQSIQAHHLATALGRIRPFEEPQKKAFLNYNALKSGNHPLSTGDNLQDFLDWIGYSEYKQTSLDRVKPNQMPNTHEDLLMQRAIRDVSRHLNTRNPLDITEYLNNGDYTDLSSETQEFITTLMNNIGTVYPEVVDNEPPEVTNRRFVKEKEKQLSKLNELLRTGAYGPSLEGETNYATELMELENLIDTTEEGIISPEDNTLIHNRIKELRGRLYDMQTEASNLKPKKSNWWKEDYKNRDAKIEADNQAVTEMAKILLPQIMEAVPNAFPKDDKMQFLYDSSQLMRMATRALLTMDHNSHGLRSRAYGIDTSIENPKEDIASGETHSTIANHLLKNGSVIHGNMSVNEALKELGLPVTAKHKEHIRRVINQSNEMNTPLHVATLNSLLTDGTLDRVHDRDLTPYHGVDYHSLLDEGQKSAGKTEWKEHTLHSVPRSMKQHMDQTQFGQAMQMHGLNYIHSDLFGTKEIKKNSKKWPTKNTKNLLDSLYIFNPDALSHEGVVEQQVTPEETVQRIDWGNRPISAPTPESHCSIFDLWDAGRLDTGHTETAQPSFGMEIGTDGNAYFGPYADTGALFSVPEEILNDLHGQETVNQIMQLPGVTPQKPAQYQQVGYSEPHSSDRTDIANQEMTQFLESLLNPDALLTKASKDDWIPLIRPMHRIFTLEDLKEFRGFSGSWVVSTWYEGKRLLLIKDDDILFLDENGKKSGVPKKIRDAATKLSDNDFIIDGVLQNDEFYIHDIISYDGTDASDMNTNERLKILRGQLESHDGILIPGPFNTRVTDEEGLENAVNDLKDEGRVLLRDAQSTYMKGEKRHPKWLILREGKTLNFIILDKRGKGPFTYQLGAGPILTPEGLGNRAVEYKGKHYMDVGTAHRVAKPFAEGDIVEGVIASVTKKSRGGRDIFNVQFTSIEKEGEGEGPASAESLSLLTKSFSPVIIPHDIDLDGNVIKILLDDVDTVEYEVKKWDNNWYLENPTCVMGDLKKSNYSYNLSESLRPFWEPVVSLMLKGYVEKLMYTENKDEEDEEERIEEDSAGILNQKEKNILLKPSMVKALEVALRALDVISKERSTWTGPKGLGIDMATPVESPRGPTNLRDPATLPDYDAAPRPGEDPEKPHLVDKKRKDRLTHAKLESNEGESIDFDIDNDQPTVRFS